MYFSSSPAPSYAGAAAEDYKTTVKSSNSQAKSLPLHNSYASQQPSKGAYSSPKSSYAAQASSKSSYDIQAGPKSSYEDYLVPKSSSDAYERLKSSYEALASPKSSYGVYGKPKMSAEYSGAVLPPHLAGSATKQYAATQPPVAPGAHYPSHTAKDYTVSKYSLTVILTVLHNSLLMPFLIRQSISFSAYERSAKFSCIITIFESNNERRPLEFASFDSVCISVQIIWTVYVFRC
jgi:hypothetical protein